MACSVRTQGQTDPLNSAKSILNSAIWLVLPSKVYDNDFVNKTAEG